MSARTLHLTITTPGDVLVDASDIRSVRAEDESGGFGILPGHADLLTVLPASVVRWRDRADTEHYCVLRAGVLVVSDGAQVAIACRQGMVGADLDALEAEVDRFRSQESDIDRRARVEQMQLHARAVRQLMHYLRPGPDGQTHDSPFAQGEAP
ncbi:F0F1 ATP synthase subunit epsilon [Amorphus sp. 3PC139-8]|uniref:F0F1 ATP synthase subunit epsilon n=1 Tax=Amorphus sp. 3PC139-8 TaxID=2735676 RepID=UPI00345CDC90